VASTSTLEIPPYWSVAYLGYGSSNWFLYFSYWFICISM